MKGGGGREEGDFILDPEFEGTVAIKSVISINSKYPLPGLAIQG